VAIASTRAFTSGGDPSTSPSPRCPSCWACTRSTNVCVVVAAGHVSAESSRGDVDLSALGWSCCRRWCRDVLLVEPRYRRWRTAPSWRRIVVSAVLLEAMLAGHPSVKLGTYHLAYSIGLLTASSSSPLRRRDVRTAPRVGISIGHLVRVATSSP